MWVRLEARLKDQCRFRHRSSPHLARAHSYRAPQWRQWLGPCLGRLGEHPESRTKRVGIGKGRFVGRVEQRGGWVYTLYLIAPVADVPKVLGPQIDEIVPD